MSEAAQQMLEDICFARLTGLYGDHTGFKGASCRYQAPGRIRSLSFPRCRWDAEEEDRIVVVVAEGVQSTLSSPLDAFPTYMSVCPGST